MRLLLSLFREHYSNVKEMLLGKAFSESIDEYAALQLKNYLLIRNSRRILFFSAVQFLIGIISLIVSLADVQGTGAGGVLCITGSVMLAGAGLLFFSFYYQELNHRQQDHNRLNTYFYIYWAAFIGGGLVLSFGEYQGSDTFYYFFIFAAAALVVPILRLFDSLIVTAVFVVSALIYGFSEGLGFGFYAALLISALAYFWILAVKYRCYAGMWFSERQLDMAAERCHQISQTDSLTGMLNRVGLTAKFYERYESGDNASGGHRIAVMLIDVDNFRLYNHMYGYDKSDGCLSKICSCIRIFAKPVTKMVSRFGGDDFVLILEDMSPAEVLSFAEQIRRGVETMAIALGEKNIVTISIGISEIVELKGKETFSLLLSQADIQLMTAKKNGKNCVGYHGRAFISDDRK